MQTKHTPAPWFVNGPFIGDSDFFIRTNIDGVGFDIATLNVDETGDYEANAKLIAAAPELLQHLSYLSKAVKERRYNDADIINETCFDIISKAAI